MLKIKWTERIMEDGVFQRAKEEILLLKILKNRRHSWIGNIIRHKEFVVNILEGAIVGEKSSGKTSTKIIKASRQKHRSGQLYRNEKNGLQQIQMESCQQIKRLRDKKYDLTCCKLNSLSIIKMIYRVYIGTNRCM